MIHHKTLIAVTCCITTSKYVKMHGSISFYGSFQIYNFVICIWDCFLGQSCNMLLFHDYRYRSLGSVRRSVKTRVPSCWSTKSSLYRCCPQQGSAMCSTVYNSSLAQRSWQSCVIMLPISGWVEIISARKTGASTTSQSGQTTTRRVGTTK